MTLNIRFFGSIGARSVCVKDDEEEISFQVDRDVGFDHDEDNHWVVWAARSSGANSESEHITGGLGSIIVKDPTVIAFLNTLGNLIANPDAFSDEPTFAMPSDESPPTQIEGARSDRQGDNAEDTGGI